MATGIFDTQVFNSFPYGPEDSQRNCTPEVLRRCGAVIQKFSLEKSFGLANIHRHFNVAPNEVLVERDDVYGYTVRPEVQSTAQNFSPTMWKFQGNQLMPLQFKEVLPALQAVRIAL